MKYSSEYQDRKIAGRMLRRINELSRAAGAVTLMEVCGTHTVAIFRHGIKRLLPGNIRLISGPGCPVCVTAPADVDRAVAIAGRPEVTFVTFGDMIRVPGSRRQSLAAARARGADVRVVYSCLDALKLSRENPRKKVVFFGIGFETTSPTVAATLIQAKKEKLGNFFILSSFKLIPPAIKALVEAGEVGVDGFLLPGHVSTILGSRPYQFISEKYGIPAVIAGFEPPDILSAVRMLIEQKLSGRPRVEIQYTRSVRPEGNPLARQQLAEVFAPAPACWRGLGVISDSGLKLKNAFRRFSAEERFPVKITPVRERSGCRCGEVIRGVLPPTGCSFFRKTCTPENPLGPCMVSSEGTCAAYYQYGE